MKRNNQNLPANRKAFAVIVLAAGMGVRMKSPLSKVLHPIVGKPMILRTIEILKRIDPAQIILVASPNNAKMLKKLSGECDVVVQPLPVGTADATKYGLKHVKREMATVAVLYGDDSAFYKPQTILAVYQLHKKTSAKITFVTVRRENPIGLGRIVRKDGNLVRIVEEKDASLEERSIKEVNASVYFFEKDWLIKNLSKISPSSVTGEYYITDLIGLAINQEERVITYPLKDESQWHSVNTKEELKEAQNKFLRRIHIMGVAGAGAAAVAGIAKGYDFEVSGCDLKPDSAYAQNLKGIEIKKGHNPSHLVSIGHLVVSPAVLALDPNNEEIQKAKQEKIPISIWQEFQGEYLQKDKFVIAVAGAYGKSTTTAMISQILIDAHLDPTCEVGATVIDWGKNFRIGKSKYYLCEADEYNNNFLNYHPDIAVILNIDWDHPDFFKNQKAVFASYKRFIENIKPGGILIVGPDPKLTQLVKSAKSPTGVSDPKGVKVANVEDFAQLKLSIIGDFRRTNANAAMTVAKILNLDLTKAKKSVEQFNGTGRRLEYKGKIKNVMVFDDYAVQPKTVRTTIDALCDKYKERKVLLVFEPHTFSRIDTFFNEFAQSLARSKADKILVTEVYPAREKGNKRQLALKLTKAIGPKAAFSGSLTQTVSYLRKNLKNFDVVLSMGAGDIYKVYDFLK